MKTRIVIGVYGRNQSGGSIGAGKTTFAGLLVEEFEKRGVNAVHTSFADNLKHMCSLKFGVDIGHFYDDSLKNTPLWRELTARDVAEIEGTENTHGYYGRDFWVKRLLESRGPQFRRGVDITESFLNADVVVVDDVRFSTEAERFRTALNHTLVCVKGYGSQAQRGHLSDQGFDEHENDHVVENKGDLSDLRKWAVELVLKLYEESRLNRFSDQSDQATSLEAEFTQASLVAARQRNKPEQVQNPDGSWPIVDCVDCEEPIPPARLALARIRCVDCQSYLEKRRV